jgi:hypothetical protein
VRDHSLVVRPHTDVLAYLRRAGQLVGSRPRKVHGLRAGFVKNSGACSSGAHVGNCSSSGSINA